MKNIFICLGMFAVFSCKAQQIYPLNTDYETIPAYSYIKDLNNYLNPFTGTYKANYQGNDITLYITKVEHKLEESIDKNYCTDALIIKYIVKDSSGTILQDTQTNPSNIDFYSIGTMTNFNAVVLFYSGTNCLVGNGKVYLRKNGSTQILWDYRPNSMLLDQQNFPWNQDVKVYLPVTKDLIFTKQ